LCEDLDVFVANSWNRGVMDIQMNRVTITESYFSNDNVQVQFDAAVTEWIVLYWPLKERVPFKYLF
jgi:hypothetical protein